MAILCTVMIFILCLMPPDDLPSNSWLSQFPGFDKIVHFGLHFVFATLLLLGPALYKNKLPLTYYLSAFLLPLSCGILIELLQPMMGRSQDIEDVFFNVTGCLTAILLFYWKIRNFVSLWQKRKIQQQN